MATVTTSPAEESLRANLMQLTQSIVDTKIDDLVQSPRLGEILSFQAGRSLFEKTVTLYRLLGGWPSL